MWSLVKKILATLIVLFIVCYTLNLHIAGRPTRTYVSNFWNNPKVQRVYLTIKNRIKALLNKDISVEDVFKPDPELNQDKKRTNPEEPPPPSQDKKVPVEHITPQDKEKLKQILQENK